jgi:hypothetical protein
MNKTLKKKEVIAAQKRLLQLELANGSIINAQLHLSFTSYKKNKRLQTQIHKREDWKNYVR